MDPVGEPWRSRVPTQPPSHPLSGETLGAIERLIVAPAIGVFRPGEVGAGATVRAGDEIGMLEGRGSADAICSPFAGRFMGHLAHPGERVSEGQPVAWLRTQ